MLRTRLIAFLGVLVTFSAITAAASTARRPEESPRGTVTVPTSGSGGATFGSAGGSSATAPKSTKLLKATTFSIRYPAGWVVKDLDQPHAWGLDTTVVDGGKATTLLRVDLTPKLGITDPGVAAGSVVAQVSAEAGYQQLALRSTTLAGQRCEYWAFEVDQGGVLLHEVDEFIVTRNLVGYAILTEAPQKDYASLAKLFTALRSTFALR